MNGFVNYKVNYVLPKQKKMAIHPNPQASQNQEGFVGGILTLSYILECRLQLKDLVLLSELLQCPTTPTVCSGYCSCQAVLQMEFNCITTPLINRNIYKVFV